MSLGNIEKKVKTNAGKLDKVIDGFKADQTGNYIVFDGLNHFFSESFPKAIQMGEKAFGENSGFVVRKIGAVPTFSNLVKK